MRNKLIYVAAATAFSLLLNVPTGALAAPLGGLGYETGGATIEYVRSRGGGGGRQFSGGGRQFSGGGRNWSGSGNWGGRGNWNGNRHWNGNWHGGGHWNGGWGGFGGWGFPGFGWGLGAGILGFGLGAAIANDGYYHDNYGYQYMDDHVARCAAHYRSYDPGSDTFLGYDGYRHYCNL